MTYGLRWKQVGRNDEIEVKEKDFESREDRERFIHKLEQKGNFLEVVAIADPEEDIVEEQPTPKQKTCGVFKVTSDTNKDFYYVGASTQIEVAFRDYMNWVRKGKAPRAIQEEAERNQRITDIFNWELLEECENNKETLKARKKAWKDQLAGNEPETDELDPGDMTVEQRNELILERLQTGDSVADVAEAFGVSKSTVYNIRNAAR